MDNINQEYESNLSTFKGGSSVSISLSSVHAVNLKMRINEIYFADCSSNVINPALTDSVRDMLNLKRYTNPQADFKAMIGA